MSELAPNTSTQTPAGNTQVKFAGKYDSPEAFDKGMREGMKAAGLAISDKVKLYGEGGMFADIKEAEANYTNVERLITAKGNAAKANAAPMPGDSKDEDTNESDGIREIVAKAGLNEMELGRQHMENGKLTDEQYAAIKKVMKGATKKTIDEMVTTQIELGKVKWEAVATKAETIAGGKEKLADLVKWASQNLPKETVKTFVDQAKANPDSYPDMIEFFAMKFAQNNGGKPGGSGVGPGVGKPGAATTVIKTNAEFKALRKDVENGVPGAKERLASADMSAFGIFN